MVKEQDLVGRLRNHAHYHGEDEFGDISREAADEIERLETALADAGAIAELDAHVIRELREENAKLIAGTVPQCGCASDPQCPGPGWHYPGCQQSGCPC